MKGIQTGVAVAALLLGASAWGADSKLGTALDDSAVTAKVKAALIGNPDTKARQINVDTANGVVTLTGTVDNTTAKMSAESTARTVSGVSAVENRLMVGSDAVAGAATPGVTAPADRTVVASAAPTAGALGSESAVSGDVDGLVMQALKADKRTANLQIDVKTGSAGTVTLSGNVPTTAARSAAADVARSINGVSKVDNKIMVKKGSTY